MKSLLLACLFSLLVGGSACSKGSGKDAGPSDAIVALNLDLQAQRKVMIEAKKAYCSCLQQRHPGNGTLSKSSVETSQRQCGPKKPKFVDRVNEVLDAHRGKVPNQEFTRIKSVLDKIDKDANRCMLALYKRVPRAEMR